MNSELIPDKKRSLRQDFRGLRRQWISENKKAALPLQAHLLRFIRDFHVTDLQWCAYNHTSEEAPLALSPRKNLFFPKVIGPNIEFFKPRSDDDFVRGEYGLLEPIPEKSDPLDFKRPILLFTPAVAVDRKGGRLGMGKGYYDRFFTQHPQALRVGVVFQVQVSQEILPSDSWDLPLDWIVTERMILRTSNRSN